MLYCVELFPNLSACGPKQHNSGGRFYLRQALAHTPPLAELFLSPRGEKLIAEINGGGARNGAPDLVGATLELVRKSFGSCLALSPRAHASSLRQINKR
jgi:hypothetical protein